MFTSAYDFLRLFVTDNSENQMILFQYINIFTAHLKYDLGQVQLIAEIYRNNNLVITTHIYIYLFL